MTLAPLIRRALPAERDEVIATVTAAFAEDPAWRFILNHEYGRLAPAFAGALFDLRVACGNVWVSDDLATVAMWDSPSGDADPVQRAEEVWARYRTATSEQAYERLLSYR